MAITDLIQQYLDGPAELRKAVAGMTAQQLRAAPIPGRWSTQEVVCHVCDFEPVYADRMKRTIATDEPTVLSGDENAFAAKLAYHDRDVAEELDLIDLTRRQMARILKTLEPEDFQRRAIHSESGPVTLEKLLSTITGHIPHHIRFIEEKRLALE